MDVVRVLTVLPGNGGTERCTFIRNVHYHLAHYHLAGSSYSQKYFEVIVKVSACYIVLAALL